MIEPKLEAEQAVLGSVFIDNSLMDHLIETFKEEYFLYDAHRTLYRGFKDIYDLGHQITPFSASEAVKLSKIDDHYIVSLINAAVSGIVAQDYCKMLADHYKRCRLFNVAQQAVVFCKSSGILEKKTDDYIFDLSKALDDIAGDCDAKETHISKYTSETIQDLDKRIKGKKTSMVSVGFDAMDEMTGGGLDAGDFVLLGGSTGSGKTSIAVNILHNVAKQNIPALYFNLEMSDVELARRLLSSEARVMGLKFRSGDVSGAEMERIIDAQANIDRLPLHLYSKRGITIEEICMKTKELHRKKNIGFVVVDYIQRVRNPMQGRQRREELDEIAQELKSLAKELKIPILALAQLNDDVFHRENSIPQMSDIRDSKSISHEVDNLWLLNRPEYYLKNKKPSDEWPDKVAKWEETMDRIKGIGEVIMCKNRHGGAGKVSLRFEAQFMTYHNIE